MDEWLLTTTEIDKFNYYGESMVSEDDWDLEAMCKAQDAKTKKKLVEWLEHHFTYLTVTHKVEVLGNAEPRASFLGIKYLDWQGLRRELEEK